MKDKKLVVVLVAIIVLLLIGGAYMFGIKQNIKNYSENCGFNGELCDRNQNNQNSITWIKSREFGIYYPSNWVSNETWYLPESLKGYSEKEGTPEFSATNGNAIISWGGSMSGCKENEFDIFKPGVSITACYRGMETHIGLENVRNKITDEELKTFGDFVLRNLEEVISQQEAENLVKKSWGDCLGEGCGSFSITVNRNTNEVTAIYPQLDDSVAFVKKTGVAIRNNETWTLEKPIVSQSCHLNRGHQDFSKTPCL